MKVRKALSLVLLLVLALTLIPSAQAGPLGQGGDREEAESRMRGMLQAYDSFLQLVDQGKGGTEEAQQAFAAYDSARIRFCDYGYVAAAPMIIDEETRKAREAWEEYKRLRAQGKTDEVRGVGEPMNVSPSQLLEVQGGEDPLESTYGAFCLATPPPGYEQGVEITIRVEAEGYKPTGTTLHTQDYEPSSIQIYGLVTDKDGKPIPGATVTLADPSKTETTDASGSYQLYVETVGTKPYADKLDWVLETKVSAVNIDFKPPEIIPIPGEVPLSITATDQDGQPLKKATAIITLVDGHKMPFLTIENDRAWLDEKGQFSTKLTTRDPAGMDYVYLTDIPLQATISVEIKDREESNTLGQTEVKRPFNLALIHGVVVDNKDLKPVTQHYPPDVLGIPTNRVFKKEKNQEGDFWVMVKPNHPSRGKSIQDIMNTGGDFALKWPVEDEIPLVYSIEDAPKPGEVLELGKVGKTPLEKIKEWYTEFGTSPRTWPDGTRDEKALTGPWSSGAANNFMCSGGHIESCRFNCVAMQYKTLWFLNNLKNKKADDENAKFLSKLKGWDYSAVIGVCPPWPQHNAVALWDRGKKWWGDTGTLPPAGSGAIILDPHGKQKPHQYSADTVLFSWTIEESMEKMYEGNGWKPQWTKPNAKQSKNRAVAVHCPVDVLVVNSQGQRLGILPNGDKVAEFEPIDSYFWQDEKGDKQWFFALPQDTYEIELLGTGSGNFHLLTSPSGEEIHDYGDNPIAAGDQATLIMNPEGDELTLADGSKPMFEVIPLESERLALPFPAHLLLFATGGIAGLAFFALLLFLLVTRRRPAPAAPPVTQPARPVRPRGRPEEFVSRRPPGRPEGPPERLGGGKPSGPPETLD